MSESSRHSSFEGKIWLAVSTPDPSVEFVDKLDGKLSVFPPRVVARSRPRPALRLVTWFSVAVLAVAVLALATSQGRTITDRFVHFIDQAAGSLLPAVSPTPMTPAGTTPETPQPAFTATPDPTPAFAGQCGEKEAPTCTLVQIRQMVSFEVMAIDTNSQGLPFALGFVGATGGPDQVWLLYRSNDYSQSVLLIEGTQPQEGFQGYEVADTAVVETVQIGDPTASAEYVYGDGISSVIANRVAGYPDQQAQSVRWTDGTVYYEMAAFNTPEQPAWWSIKQGLVELARELTPKTPNPAPGSIKDNLALSEAENLAGFHILVPEALPRGQRFDHASYSPDLQTVCLEYNSSLRIAESVEAPFPDLASFLDYPEETKTSTISIGGAKDGEATLVKGYINQDSFCGGSQGGVITLDEILMFTVQGTRISIYTKPYDYVNERNFITELEVERLAENITGVHTIPADQLDPAYVTSVADAQTFVDFPIKLPRVVHDGEELSFIRTEEINSLTWVTIYYTGSSNPMTVYETNDFTVSLDNFCENLTSSTMESTCEPTTIHGQPGLIFMAPGSTITITWMEGGIIYRIYAIYDGKPAETWLAIAGEFSVENKKSGFHVSVEPTL